MLRPLKGLSALPRSVPLWRGADKKGFYSRLVDHGPLEPDHDPGDLLKPPSPVFDFGESRVVEWVLFLIQHKRVRSVFLSSLLALRSASRPTRWSGRTVPLKVSADPVPKPS